jgi:hypothetical protein
MATLIFKSGLNATDEVAVGMKKWAIDEDSFAFICYNRLIFM